MKENPKRMNVVNYIANTSYEQTFQQLQLGQQLSMFCAQEIRNERKRTKFLQDKLKSNSGLPDLWP